MTNEVDLPFPAFLISNSLEVSQENLFLSSVRRLAEEYSHAVAVLIREAA